MAGNWLSALGAKLRDAGTAYLEQVKVVRDLQRMTPAEARQHFAQYVQGLSAAARAGFALTLSGLASNERDAAARRFIESMSQALANPQAWTAGAPPPAVPASPDTSEENPLVADAERVDAWVELPDDARERAINDHAARLSLEGLEQWRENMAELGRRMTVRMAQHRENEARIAAGRFIEDQHTYRLSRLAGAPPHAGWLAQLQQMQRVGALVETLQKFAAEVIESRREAPAEEVQPATAPGESVASNDDPALPIAASRAELEKELASGRVLGDRADTLRRLLDKLAALQRACQRNEVGADVAVHRTKQLMDEFMPYIANPGTAAVHATPRGREVIRHAGELKKMLLRQATNPLPAATAEVVGALLGDVTTVQQRAGEATDDAALLGLETGLLRPAARAAHELNLTRHALIARPLWACGEPVNRVNAIFFSGAGDLQALLETVAGAKGLEVENTRRLQNHGQMRWDALNACHVAVFDLRSAGDLASLAADTPGRARELAATAYELGLAFALGKPLLVLTQPDDELPFDIDLTPMALHGDHADADLLAHALDETFYVPQRPHTESSLHASLARLRQLVADHPQRAAIEQQWTAPALAGDPVGFAAAAGHVFERLDAPRWQLLRPAWPGAYPEESSAGGAPACFHVMPFQTPWADEVRDAAREVCIGLGLDYRRGDEAEDGRIVHAIWADLCRAAVVLVELTGVNLNVMIELGLAHAIGRPVLAVQRANTVDFRPRHVEKLRVHRYASAAELTNVLRARLLKS